MRMFVCMPRFLQRGRAPGSGPTPGVERHDGNPGPPRSRSRRRGPTTCSALQARAGNRAVTDLLTTSGPQGHPNGFPVLQRLGFIDASSGPVPGRQEDDWILAEFEVTAELNPAATVQTKGKLPRAGEYRQLIKGEFLENDQPVKDQPKLPKGRLQKNEWRQDGNVNNLIGHRDAPNSASHYHRDEGFSKKDDKHGAYFKGIDTPGQHVSRDKKISSTCSSRASWWTPGTTTARWLIRRNGRRLAHGIAGSDPGRARARPPPRRKIDPVCF